MLFIISVRVPIHTPLICHYPNGRTITPPGIFTMREPPNVERILNMFHSELRSIIPSFASIIKTFHIAWIRHYQHQFTIISYVLTSRVSECVVLRYVFVKNIACTLSFTSLGICSGVNGCTVLLHRAFIL